MKLYNLFVTTTVLLLQAQFTFAADGGGGADDGGGEVEPRYAVLFPWFALMIGVCVYFASSRYFKIVPYTADMFIIGMAMGIADARLRSDDNNQLIESVHIWADIDSEVLLLVFLPGLVFKDAFGLDLHLFQVAFWQCIILAFPMVLAGTCLVALVAFYIFPYNWSWNLAMTFGAILSATDPVAVSALLDEVGSPPRLKIHISGESLLNDGSAIVFYTIFSGLFLTEIPDADVGESVNWGEGIALFCRMSLGACAIGIAFGISHIAVLYLLNRRLNGQENVLQVTATITFAYMTYYVADVVAETSGVIAVLTLGVLTKAFGWSLINDTELMEHFWELVDHLLNTVLFTLGGLVWGSVISNEPPRAFTGQNWGYLILLYVLLMVIRFFLCFSFYPIIVRIGLKTCWQEAVFLSYGGLRGAVGIALAIALDDEINGATSNPDYVSYSNEMFGTIGGIALFTLVINGSTAGPLLKWLGLTKSTKVREKLTDLYIRDCKEAVLNDFIHLMTIYPFNKVDFAQISHHVHFLQDLTINECKTAVIKNKASVPEGDYKKPMLDFVLPYLKKDEEEAKNDLSWATEFSQEQQEEKPKRAAELGASALETEEASLLALQESHGSTEETKELRLVFLELVRGGYERQVEKGYLDARRGAPGFTTYVLDSSLDFATDAVNSGKPLSDWEYSHIVKGPLENSSVRFMEKLKKLLPCFVTEGEIINARDQALNNDVNRALAFIYAHKYAQEMLEKEISSLSEQDVSEAEQIVLKESQDEVRMAEESLSSRDPKDIEMVVAHRVSTILLNKAAHYVGYLLSTGFVTQTEADGRLEEIDEELHEVAVCSQHDHPGQLDKEKRKSVVDEMLKKNV